MLLAGDGTPERHILATEIIPLYEINHRKRNRGAVILQDVKDTMKLLENINLRSLHTFHMDVTARYFARFTSEEELSVLLPHAGPLLVLGGGSNVLFLDDYPGVVLKNDIKGFRVVHEDAEYVYLQVGAGEDWHRLVLYTIERGWGGLENLSLIPGSVGAAPIQNIGAYGVELEAAFWDLEAFHLQEKKKVTFTKSDCAFGYRDSIFKGKFKHTFAILSVTFRLQKHPVFHTAYGMLQQELDRMGVSDLSLRVVAQAVINIRSTKLPDPEKIGNAGSFFKNPTIPLSFLGELVKQYPSVPFYRQPDDVVKIPAGWLIEQCGWKGYRKGDAGCYPLQALVLVNYGGATGAEIMDICQSIQADVQKKFGIPLVPEVNIIGAFPQYASSV